MQLLPHQVGLVDTFFSSASKQTIILRADVGLGRSTALLAVASRLLRERPQARVLIVVPGVGLRVQFAYRLREAGTPTLDVDRYRFREMIDSSTGGNVWPVGYVAVINREFARQEDIRNSLASTRWDLSGGFEQERLQSSCSPAASTRNGTAVTRIGKEGSPQEGFEVRGPRGTASQAECGSRAEGGVRSPNARTEEVVHLSYLGREAG